MTHSRPIASWTVLKAPAVVSDLRLLALNSYENRVYQVGIEGGTPVIAKFYREGRWSDEQILEEHAFSAELVEPRNLRRSALRNHRSNAASRA